MRIIRLRKYHGISHHYKDILPVDYVSDLLGRWIDLFINRDIHIAIQLQDYIDVFLLNIRKLFRQEMLFNFKILPGTVLGNLHRQNIYNPIRCVQKIIYPVHLIYHPIQYSGHSLICKVVQILSTAAERTFPMESRITSSARASALVSVLLIRTR